MEPRGCFYHNRLGYRWLDGGQWIFQAVDEHGHNLENSIEVDVEELVFEHEEDENSCSAMGRPSSEPLGGVLPPVF